MSAPLKANVAPKALKVFNKSISFPYINKNINADPVNRLIVDIIEEHSDPDIPSNFYTASLKYIFCEYYPQYSQYLKTHTQTTLQEEIHNYYNTIILTQIEYKYKVGQFGYVYNSNSLEQSFVQITEKLDATTDIFFLHEQLKKYKYHHYDITSPTPKIFTDDEFISDHNNNNVSDWTIQSLFTPIDGTIEPTNDATNYL
eukprot:418471_1